MARKSFALIPARGGSKGVSRKNTRKVGDLTLVERAVLGAVKSQVFNRIVVSSDDDEILALASRAGANCLRRPARESRDSAQASEVVEHFLDSELAGELDSTSLIVYLQPTSPFRTERHILGALSRMEETGARSLVSVRGVMDHPRLTLTVNDCGELEGSNFSDWTSTNRQDYPTVCIPNGAIYAFLQGDFRSSGRIPIEGAVPYFMSRIDSWDIDTEDDLVISRALADHAGI